LGIRTNQRGSQPLRRQLSPPMRVETACFEGIIALHPVVIQQPLA
jgi:hypothetical protein